MANTELRNLHMFGNSITNIYNFYIYFNTDPLVGIAVIAIDSTVFND